MKLFLIFAAALTLFAEDTKPTVEQLQAQLAAKDAEIQQWKEYGQELSIQNQKLMTLLQGFLGKVPQPPTTMQIIPKPPVTRSARPSKEPK